MSEKGNYICSCFKITKKDLKQYIKNGYTDYTELQKNTKIGTKCSKCETRTKEKFNKFLTKAKGAVKK